LFTELKKEKMLEVVRFEVRLHKSKMDEVLERLGYKKGPVFKDVFNTEMSKKVVIDYWQKIIKERNIGLFSIEVSIKDILQNLFLADNKLKPKQAIYLLGLFLLAKDENGMRQLRAILSKRSSDETWYRIAKDMRISSELITKNKVRDWVLQIDRVLENYKAYKINNDKNK
jgi:hypothetical protein